MSLINSKYKYTGITIYSSGTREKIEFDDFSFVKQEVGGYFECIKIQNMTIWINDDGKFNGLPKNIIASNISNNIKKSLVYNSPFIMELFRSYIVGNVVFLGGINKNGEVESLTDSQLYFLLNYT